MGRSAFLAPSDVSCRCRTSGKPTLGACRSSRKPMGTRRTRGQYASPRTRGHASRRTNSAGYSYAIGSHCSSVAFHTLNACLARDPIDSRLAGFSS